MALSAAEIIETLSQTLLKEDDELDLKPATNGTSGDDTLFDFSALEGKWYG